MSTKQILWTLGLIVAYDMFLKGPISGLLSPLASTNATART